MKIVIIGASGTVGRAVTEELSRRHEVIRVGRTQGDHQVDITSQASVQALFEKIGPVDAIVSASGGLHFGPLATMTDGEFNRGLQDKLLGQVRGADRPALPERRWLDYADKRDCGARANCAGRQRHHGQCGAGRVCARRSL